MLYQDFMQECRLMTRSRIADGEGGWTTGWSEGKGFEAAIVLDSTIDARVAEASATVGVYTVTTQRGIGLAFHDVFKRVSDGAGFRITKVNDPTPGVASFQFDQYQAESWELA